LKPGHILCEHHKITDFDSIYEIVDGKVRRKSDQALVLLLGDFPLEDRYNPNLIRSCLTGTGIENYRNLPIASVEHIPLQSYYRITADIMHGDESLEIFDASKWLRS
jgi:hypothetical protein